MAKPSKNDASRSSRARDIQKLKKLLKKDPTDEAAFVQLWDVFAAAESWEAAAELLRARADNLSDAKTRVRVLLRLGSLFDERLGDVGQAIATYRQVLELEEGNRRALWALSVLLHDKEDWEGVIEIYLKRIRLAASLEEKLSLRSQLAQIYEQRLQQEDRALIEYIRAARMAPQNLRILLHLESLATRTESFRELLAVYEDVVERIESIDLRVALYLKLGRLYAEHMDDPDKAEACQRRALELARDQVEMLFSLSTLYGEEGEWDALIETYTQLIHLAEGDEIKSRLRREIARLYRRGLHDPTAAFYELLRVARYNPALPGLMADLFDLASESDHQLEAAAIAQELLSRLELKPQRLDLLMRLGRLQLDDLDDASSAVDTARQAVALDPSSVMARALLVEALKLTGEDDDLRQAIGEALALEHMPDDVAERMRILLPEQSDPLRPPASADSPKDTQAEQSLPAAPQDAFESALDTLMARKRESQDPESRANLAVEIAELLEKRMGRVDQAFFELLPAARMAPEHAKLSDELFRLARLTGYTRELEAVVDDVLPTLSPELGASMLMRLGLLAEGEKRPEDAERRYCAALELDGTQPVAYQKLRSRAENHGDAAKIAALDLRRASVISSTSEKIELLLSAAHILEEDLKDGARAHAVFERVLKLDPDHDEARKGFERLAQAAAAAEGPLDAELMQATPGGLQGAAKAPAGATISGIKLQDRRQKSPAPKSQEDVAEIFSPPPIEDVAEIYSPPRKMEIDHLAQDLLSKPIESGEDEAEEDRLDTDVGGKPIKDLDSELQADAEAHKDDERQPTLVTTPPKRAADQSRALELIRNKAQGAAEKKGRAQASVDAEKEARRKAEQAAREDAERKATEGAAGEAEQQAPGPAAGEALVEIKRDLRELARARAQTQADVQAQVQAQTDARDMGAADAEQAAGKRAESEALKLAYKEARESAQRKGLSDACQQAEDQSPAPVERVEEVDAALIEEIDEREARTLDLQEAEIVPAEAEEAESLVEEIGEDEVEIIEDEDESGPFDDGPTQVESSAAQSEPAPATPEFAEAAEAKGEPDEFAEEFVEEKTSPGGPSGPEQILWKTARGQAQDPDAWEKLAAHLQSHDGDEAAFNALEEGAGAIEDPEQQARLFRRMSLLSQSTGLRARLSRLLETKGHMEEAESSYRAVLRAEPGHEEALDGLLRIYEQRGAVERYDAILTRTLGGLTDASARRTLLLRRARLRTERLDRPSDALEDLEQLLLADDRDLDALDALRMQESILEKTERYDDLVKAYRAHLPYCFTPEERVDLLVAIGVLYENQLDNPQQAISHYRKALKEAPERLSTLEALVNLLEQRRDWVRAIEALRLAGEAQPDPDAASRIHYRLGKILEEQLLRPDEAERAYRKAINSDVPSPEALVALKGMARRRGDWVDVLRLGHMQVDLCEDPKERAGLLVELARAWRERLENEDKALECYERALRDDPDNVEAGEVVAGLRLKDRRHAEAHELLEHLAQLSEQSGQDDSARAAIHLKLAQTAEALGKPERAGLAYARALELAPRDGTILSQYGYHLSRQGDWDKAIELYQRILEEHRDILGEDELADLHCMLAQGRARLGDPEKAVEEYQRAMAANPKHLPAIRASIELARQLSRWPQVVSLLRRYREVSPSPQAQQKVSMQIGDLQANTLDDPAAAAESYREALQAEPDNAEILEKLRRVLVHAERFGEAVDVLKQLAHISDNERQKARYLKIAGDILRERLDEDRKALDCYLRALEAAPLDQRTHSSAVKILNRLRDWPRLARLYEELLHRLPPPIAGQDDQRVSILTELVDLYRYRLEDRPRAIAACEQLLRLVPGDLKIREDLARLYASQKDYDAAIRTHRELIAASPFSIDSYHALLHIYEGRGERDRTLCMAATLSFLDEANEDETALLKAHRHALPLPRGRRMSEENYNKHLLHPDAGGLLGELFSFAADHARALFVSDQREFRLRSREQLDLKSDAKLAEVFRQGLDFLGLPAPEVYSKGASVKGILAVNTSPTAVLYSDEAVRHASIAELRFMAARALAFTRPENLLAASLSPGQLRMLMDALVDLAMPSRPLDPGPEVGALTKRLDKVIPRKKRERLGQLAQQVLERAEELSIRTWLEGVEHTCNRAGLVQSGDLEAAVKVLKGARVVSPSGSNRSLIRELIFYSISDAYFELRRVLDAAI